MAKTIPELAAQADMAQQAYLALQTTGTQDQIYAAGRTVKAARKALSDLIAAGAKPCPDCKEAPHGMMQPMPKGRTEWEIGCLACGDFDQGDGTIRKHAARGGPLPRHAVEAWNEGPSGWLIRE